MQNGISVYAGLDCSIEENLNLLETAISLGLRRIFTSVAIPEANQNYDTEFATILATAIENNLEIILDITPETISTFDFALDFEQITPRLDDGFNPMQIAALSHIRRIMLNASTVDENLLMELIELKADFSNISALHNFYPQVYSGLDITYFRSQNQLLHKFGIPTGAFAASLNGRRRAPLAEGLPTVEFTRNFPTNFTARYLSALGTDFIIISDSLPTYEECAAIANIKHDEITLHANLLSNDPISTKLLSKTFIARPEISPCIIRAANSRSPKNFIEPDNNPKSRKPGDITINNANFRRYMGEVQIVKMDLPADLRVNTVAKIADIDLLLLECLNSNQAFAFRFV